jgi:hypothetical protein
VPEAALEGTSTVRDDLMASRHTVCGGPVSSVFSVFLKETDSGRGLFSTNPDAANASD